MGKRGPNAISQEIRFLNKFKKGNPDECWQWQASKDACGYGMFGFQGRTGRAHRFSYEHFVGPIPKGILVCHKCDNPPCVNPKHLFLGTPKDNMRDRHSKGKYASVIGSKNGNAVLDEKKVANIKKLLNAKGLQLKEISVLFGVSTQMIWRIKHGWAWNHV